MHRRTSILAFTAALLLLRLSMASTVANASGPVQSPRVGAALPSSMEAELIRHATLVFRRAVDTPSAAIPASVMQRAQLLAVFPAAVGDGECYSGTGIGSARGADGTWMPPAVMAFQGEIPVSLDVQTVDFVFVAITPRGAEYFSRAVSSLAGNSVIVPGPLGQDTRINMNTDILGYMQFGDFFAGVTVAEFSQRQMKDANERLYGRRYSTAEVWRGGFRMPMVAELWRDTLQSYFREMS